MTPKPSRPCKGQGRITWRMDSLEKAARKEAQTWINISIDGVVADMLEAAFVRFATRHGAKVRRETIKECAAIAARPEKLRHGVKEGDNPQFTANEISLAILSLTPRGPEKGRRAK